MIDPIAFGPVVDMRERMPIHPIAGNQIRERGRG